MYCTNLRHLYKATVSAQKHDCYTNIQFPRPQNGARGAWNTWNNRSIQITLSIGVLGLLSRFGMLEVLGAAKVIKVLGILGILRELIMLGALGIHRVLGVLRLLGKLGAV